MSRVFWSFCATAVVVLVAAGLVWLGLGGKFPHAKSDDALKRPLADLPPYGGVIAAIDTERRALGTRLAIDRSQGARQQILADARRLLERAVTRDLPAHWLGTPWDFNGTSETPGEGQIACGYFVSTVLRDAGFDVERVRLAQQASGNIIRSLTTPENTTRLVGKSFDEFLTELRAAGPGVYVIGLDNHVGLIAQNEHSSAFIHSDGGAHQCVIVEPVEKSPALRRSRWREFANLSADDALLQKWLLGGRFPTVVSL